MCQADEIEVSVQDREACNEVALILIHLDWSSHKQAGESTEGEAGWKTGRGEDIQAGGRYTPGKRCAEVCTGPELVSNPLRESPRWSILMCS